jgi:lactoylglutathione lyase
MDARSSVQRHHWRPVAVSELIPLLRVADLDRSIDFYEALGFRVEDDFEQEGWRLWARLRSGDAQLTLALAGEPAHAHEHAGQALLYLLTDDLDGLRGRLSEAGIAPGPIEEQPGPGPRRELRVEDPAGYAWMVAERA